MCRIRTSEEGILDLSAFCISLLSIWWLKDNVLNGGKQPNQLPSVTGCRVRGVTSDRMGIVQCACKCCVHRVLTGPDHHDGNGGVYLTPACLCTPEPHHHHITPWTNCLRPSQDEFHYRQTIRYNFSLPLHQKEKETSLFPRANLFLSVSLIIGQSVLNFYCFTHFPSWGDC